METSTMGDFRSPHDDYAEEIGQLADTVDNLLHAAKLPLPPAVHLEHILSSLETVRDILRKIHVGMTGENPWSDYGEV